jgi:membrane fusion protein, heavy metal efflux system
VDGERCVFVEREAGRFQPRPVTVQPLPDGRLQLVSGVRPGERVVVEGAFTLVSELAREALGEGHAH